MGAGTARPKKMRLSVSDGKNCATEKRIRIFRAFSKSR